MSNTTTIPHDDTIILEGLINHDRNVIEGIYKRLSGKIIKYITDNNGSEADAGDIFQETIIDLFKQYHHQKLVLTCPFDAFFIMVAKRKWLNFLKKPLNKGVTNADDNVLANIAEDSFKEADIVVENGIKEKIYREQLKTLSERCQEVILATLQSKPQEEVAATLGVSYNYLRKKKSECLDELVTRIHKVYKLQNAV